MHVVVFVNVVLKFVIRVESALNSLDGADEAFDDVFYHIQDILCCKYLATGFLGNKKGGSLVSSMSRTTARSPCLAETALSFVCRSLEARIV